MTLWRFSDSSVYVLGNTSQNKLLLLLLKFYKTDYCPHDLLCFGSGAPSLSLVSGRMERRGKFSFWIFCVALDRLNWRVSVIFLFSCRLQSLFVSRENGEDNNLNFMESSFCLFCTELNFIESFIPFCDLGFCLVAEKMEKIMNWAFFESHGFALDSSVKFTIKSLLVLRFGLCLVARKNNKYSFLNLMY